MGHVNEQKLDLYILKRGAVEESLRVEVEAHLNHCAACTKIFEFLKSFYSELEEYQDVDADMVERIIQNEPRSSNVIELHPFKPQLGLEAVNSQYLTVLAAMSNQPAQQRYQTVSTLASEKDKALVRIMYDRTEVRYHLYVNTKDPRQCRHAIISFPALSTDFVTDGDGKVSFPAAQQMREKDWSSTECVLLTAIVEYQLRSEEIQRLCNLQTVLIEREDNVSRSLKLEYSETTLHVHVTNLDNSHPGITRALVRTSAQEKILVYLENGDGTCRMASPLQELTLLLYH